MAVNDQRRELEVENGNEDSKMATGIRERVQGLGNG